MNQWQEILNHSDQIVEDVVASIDGHMQLGPFWQALTNDMREIRIGIFQCILLSNITHPDGTVSIQREI